MNQNLYKFIYVPVIFFIIISLCSATDNSSKTEISLDEILNKIESRYSGLGFSAKFEQVSTIKAMEIKDTAKGSIIVKRPGKMRWEYEMPETQLIITDGITMWIYRPVDNQVLTGKSPEYFADGKGASFLSDMKMIRKKFNISLENFQNPDHFILKLIPMEKKYEIDNIILWISKINFDILNIITINTYGDETSLFFSSYQHNQNPDDKLFQFIIPFGVDVLQIEE